MTDASAAPTSYHPEWDCLLIACQKGDIELVRSYVREQGIDPNHSNAIRQSALHVAAWWARVECVEFLLEQGANVHATNTMTGATPLHCSLQSTKAALQKSKRVESIRLLLEHGADPTKLDSLGRTPLEYLDEQDIDYKDIMALFESSKGPIFTLLAQRDLTGLQAELNATQLEATTQGRTPLLQLVHSWCGLDMDEEFDQFKDPFFPSALELLLQAGANTAATDDDGETSLDVLCSALVNRYKLVKTVGEDPIQTLQSAIDMLISHGTEVTTITKSHWLDIGRRNYLDLAKLWWSQWNISPAGVVNRQGMSPLQFAARSGHYEMVEFILKCYSREEKEAALKLMDKMGHTAMTAAETNGHGDIVKLLEDNR